MQEQIKKLETFHKVFGLDVATEPTLVKKELSDLRYDMSLEELNEYKEACENGDLVEILDSIVDRIYLAIGDAVVHGLLPALVPAFDEVHASNMSKLDKHGEAIINGVTCERVLDLPIGKVLKSEFYFRPNLKRVLKIFAPNKPYLV